MDNIRRIEFGAKQALSPVLTASDCRDLAQYLLSAAVQLQRGTLSLEAQSQIFEWTRANSYMARVTGEGPQSVAAKATQAAIGMLTHHQAARDVAATECVALLESDDRLKERLADGDWEDAGHQIAAVVIAQYLSALQARQK